MEMLVLLALIVAVASLWSRLRKLEATVEMFELARYDFGSEPVAALIDEVDVPEPAISPAELMQTASTVIRFEVPRDELIDAPDKHVEEHAEEQADIASPPRKAFSFEDMFGRRLPIWAGGVTLAVAGLLIVKYSIDAGLVSPLVRVISGLLFGTVLIAAAEAALRAEARVRDARVRQALAGAGVASLYGAILIAANLYGLIGPFTAFIAMALCTALAMGLSLRFGAPSALLGLAGGLAAPALVGSTEPNIPLLTSYLALAVGGLCVLSSRQKWVWLGISALAGGFLWSAILLATGVLGAAATISLAVFILLLGMGLPILLAMSGKIGDVVRVLGSVAAAGQMAALVATGGFTPLNWALYGLLSVAILWLSSRDPRLARLPALGLGIAILLAVAWPDPTPIRLTLVLVIGGALYAGVNLRTLWRADRDIVDATCIAAIALAALFIPLFHFYRADGSTDSGFALLGLGVAILPAAAAALGWRNEGRNSDARFALLATTSAFLVAAAGVLGLPSWAVAPIIGLVGLTLLLLGIRARDQRLEYSAWAFAAAGLLLMINDANTVRLLGQLAADDARLGFVSWAGLAAILSLFAWKASSGAGRMIAQGAAALLAYGALAQLVPPDFLALIPAAGLFALALAARQQPPERFTPALGAFLAVAVLWAVGPLMQWSIAATASLVGTPLLVSDLPPVRLTVLQLLLPSILIILSRWQLGGRIRDEVRVAMLAVAAVAGGVALHILFKQLWSIASDAEFVRYGVAERTAWEAMILAAALIAWALGQRRWALGVSVAGLAHFAWYSFIIHNPLLAEQEVGNLPVLNLLLPMYAIPLAWLWIVRRHEPDLPTTASRAGSAATMVLITALAYSLLRQLFHGSILAGPAVSAGEDIFRSILALVLALGFLLWGIRHALRDWRIASLLLMIAAVGKVFLFDAADLDGLLRIGSFVALGISLIGLGWLYSRFLGADEPQTAT